MRSIHLLIKGKVQGVFFRASAKEVAESLGVTGWIKNAATGDVEVTVSGTEQQLQKFTEWCKQGPKRAHVTEVVVSEIPEQEFAEFNVIR